MYLRIPDLRLIPLLHKLQAHARQMLPLATLFAALLSASGLVSSSAPIPSLIERQSDLLPLGANYRRTMQFEQMLARCKRTMNFWRSEPYWLCLSDCLHPSRRTASCSRHSLILPLPSIGTMARRSAPLAPPATAVPSPPTVSLVCLPILHPPPTRSLEPLAECRHMH